MDTGKYERNCSVCDKIFRTSHRTLTCSEYCAKERKALYSRAYAEKDPFRTRNRHYIKRYGIGLEEVQKKLDAQGNVCAICSKPIFLNVSRSESLAVVDHCHTSKNLRDMLCTPCNLLIGYSQESIDTLKKAIVYLERHNG